MRIKCGMCKGQTFGELELACFSVAVLSITIMSDNSSKHSTPKPDMEPIQLSVSLTYHKKTQATDAAKGSGKTMKDIKKKEAMFHLADDNYVLFLCALLATHGETKYQVSANNVFWFKYYYKGCK